jgi:hypothetical protein
MWFDGEQMRCKVGYADLFQLRDAAELWTWCANHPVHYVAYQIAARTHAWPSDDANLPIIEEVNRAISQSTDGGELEDLSLKIEASRKAENAAHLEAKRNVDAKFKVMQELIASALKALKQKERAA